MSAKKLWFIIGGSILVIVAAVTYLMVTKPAMPVQNTVDRTTNPPQTTQPQPPATSQKGEYIPYNEAAVAETKNTKLLFFHAAWCPQCRALEQSITQQGVPAGLSIFKVDYDNATALRQKYGVTLQTTVIRIDDQGNLVTKFVAYDDPTLQAVIKAFNL